MAILKYILFFLLAVLLNGCYENFNPRIDTKPVLCINALIIAGEQIKVDVSRTWMFDDKESATKHEVNDVKIDIFANGKKVGIDYLPKNGDIIQILANSTTYGNASAEVVVPELVPITDVRVSHIITSIWSGAENSSLNNKELSVSFDLNVELDVDDPIGVDKFYYFAFDEYCDNKISDMIDCQYKNITIGTFLYDLEPIFREHIGSFETILGTDEVYSFSFFTDRQFPGKTYTLHLNFTNNVFNVVSDTLDDSLFDCGINLYLASISQSYYNSSIYKWYLDEGITGDLADIGLAESKWGYSNVSTGAGVVAAQSISKHTISLKDFLNSIINNKLNKEQ
ncbi:MAG: DUF4249 family protein [Muribaculaceae bacterium]